MSTDMVHYVNIHNVHVHAECKASNAPPHHLLRLQKILGVQLADINIINVSANARD